MIAALAGLALAAGCGATTTPDDATSASASRAGPGSTTGASAGATTAVATVPPPGPSRPGTTSLPGSLPSPGTQVPTTPTSASTTTTASPSTTTSPTTARPTTTPAPTTTSSVKGPAPFTIGLTPELVEIRSYVELRHGGPVTLDLNLVTRAARGGGPSPTDVLTDWSIAPDCVTTSRSGTVEPTVSSFWPDTFPVWPGRPTHFGVGIARASSNGTFYAKVTVCFATFG